MLVIEDDDATRQLYKTALIAAGYRVKTVPDGLDALRALDEGPIPDAVVLDLVLPRVGGLDVYREMRAREATRHVPIVIVTGADMRRLEPSEFRHFLRKPVHPETLVAAVDSALGRSSSELIS